MSRYGSGTYGTGIYGSLLAVSQTPQESWPNEVLVAVTGLNLGEVVSIYRSVGGERTLVRGAGDITATDTSLVRVDAELPFGVPVTYVVVVDNDFEYTVGPNSYSLVGGKVAITDAITGAAAEVVISAWDERQRDRVSTTYTVGGRNVVVAGALSPTTQTIELLTEADSTRENLDAVLENATSGIVQIRQAGGYEDVDGYFAITSVTRRRYMQEGTDPRRVWSLQAIEVEPWAAALEARGFTYEDVANSYTGLTYDDLDNDFATYLAVAQGDFGA